MQVVIEYGDKPVKLSSRAVEISRMVTEGHRTASIAEKLGLSYTAASVATQRVASAVAEQTGMKMEDKTALICRFAYGAGLVRL